MPRNPTGLYSTRISFKGDDQLVLMLEDQNSAELAFICVYAFEGLLSDQAITPGGVDPHSNCSEIAVNQYIFKEYLYTIDTLQAPVWQRKEALQNKFPLLYLRISRTSLHD